MQKYNHNKSKAKRDIKKGNKMKRKNIYGEVIKMNNLPQTTAAQNFAKLYWESCFE